MILVKNVSKSYGHKIALKNVSLKLEDQKTHVFLGSSGGGKSTLLKILNGLIPYDQGEVTIGDIPLNSQTQKSITDKIGYVLQEGGLFPHLTIADNISLKAKLNNWSEDQIKNRFDELIKLFKFDNEILKKYPQSVSGGQRQRAAVMRGLFLDPKILLLDEPLGALDPLIRFHLQADLKEIFSALKKTVVIVTHDLSEAEFFGHSITLFHNGEIIQHGEFSDFIHNPASEFVTQFIQAQRTSSVSI